MTILPISPEEALRLTSSPDSDLVRKFCAPRGKKTAMGVIKEKRIRDARLEIDKTLGKKPETTPKKDTFSQLLEHSKGGGAEVYQPDSDSFVIKTNIPGYSLHFKRTSSGDVEVTLKNGKGQILSAEPNIKEPKDLERFMRKEGLSYSKNTAPNVNLSSSSLYREIGGIDR